MSHSKRGFSAVSFLLALGVPALTHAQIPGKYLLTDLGTLSSQKVERTSGAYGINASGQIVGVASTSTANNDFRAFLTSGLPSTTLNNLGTYNSHASLASSIGNAVNIQALSLGLLTIAPSTVSPGLQVTTIGRSPISTATCSIWGLPGLPRTPIREVSLRQTTALPMRSTITTLWLACPAMPPTDRTLRVMFMRSD